MVKDPAFLFYTNDFLSGITDLTMEERGQYITLLCLQHQKGHLSDKMIRLSVGNAAADVMRKFEQDENGNYYNARLELEIEKRSQHSEKQRLRAKEGWEKRKAVAYATALPLVNVNEDKNNKENKELIPTLEDFVAYGVSNSTPSHRELIVLKYKAWVEAGWHDGNGKPIKKWKSKLLNAISYMTPSKSETYVNDGGRTLA